MSGLLCVALSSFLGIISFASTKSPKGLIKKKERKCSSFISFSFTPCLFALPVAAGKEGGHIPLSCYCCCCCKPNGVQQHFNSLSKFEKKECRRMFVCFLCVCVVRKIKSMCVTSSTRQSAVKLFISFPTLPKTTQA